MLEGKQNASLAPATISVRDQRLSWEAGGSDREPTRGHGTCTSAPARRGLPALPEPPPGEAPTPALPTSAQAFSLPPTSPWTLPPHGPPPTLGSCPLRVNSCQKPLGTQRPNCAGTTCPSLGTGGRHVCWHTFPRKTESAHLASRMTAEGQPVTRGW